MYEVSVRYGIYHKWESYKKWYDGDFNEWIPVNYPEVLSVEWENNDGLNLDRIFRFDSEKMYQWFLLRQ